MQIRNRKGFTLIELMIVVVIIGILAALAIPRFGSASGRTKEKEAQTILKNIMTMQETYKAEKGSYATSVADLKTVGFETPSPQYYEAISDAQIADGYCLQANDASWKNFKIDFATGVLASC